MAYCHSADCRTGGCARAREPSAARVVSGATMSTHNHCSPVRLPMVDGKVPLNWLVKRLLRARTGALSDAFRWRAQRAWRTGR